MYFETYNVSTRSELCNSARPRLLFGCAGFTVAAAATAAAAAAAAAAEAVTEVGESMRCDTLLWRLVSHLAKSYPCMYFLRDTDGAIKSVVEDVYSIHRIPNP